MEPGCEGRWLFIRGVSTLSMARMPAGHLNTPTEKKVERFHYTTAGTVSPLNR